jgi:hypothetical protein
MPAAAAAAVPFQCKCPTPALPCVVSPPTAQRPIPFPRPPLAGCLRPSSPARTITPSRVPSDAFFCTRVRPASSSPFSRLSRSIVVLYVGHHRRRQRRRLPRMPLPSSVLVAAGTGGTETPPSADARTAGAARLIAFCVCRALRRFVGDVRCRAIGGVTRRRSGLRYICLAPAAAAAVRPPRRRRRAAAAAAAASSSALVWRTRRMKAAWRRDGEKSLIKKRKITLQRINII